MSLNKQEVYHPSWNWGTSHALIHDYNKLDIQRIHYKMCKSISLFVHMYREGWLSLWGIPSAGPVGFFFPLFFFLMPTYSRIKPKSAHYTYRADLISTATETWLTNGLLCKPNQTNESLYILEAEVNNPSNRSDTLPILCLFQE